MNAVQIFTEGSKKGKSLVEFARFIAFFDFKKSRAQNPCMRENAVRVEGQRPRMTITPKACISSCSAGTVYHQCEALYIIKAQARYTLARDEIQGRIAALDDMHRTSCGDDMPSLREPPKLALLASGNPYCGLDKKSAFLRMQIFCEGAIKKIFSSFFV